MLRHAHRYRRSALLTILFAALAALTAAGPVNAAAGPISLVKSFSSGTRDSNPGQVVVAGNLGYFSADPTGRGLGDAEWNELFRTDGTEAGTRMVKDLVPGDVGASPRDLTAVGDTLFFVAENVRVPQKLWQTDGTEAGTIPVPLDPAPGEQWRARIVGVRAGELLVVSSVYGDQYPSTTNVLWALRPGTAPRQLATLPRAPIGDLTLLSDGRLVFANYGTSPDYAAELWATETTANAETKRLARFPRPGNMGALRPSGSKVYFAGSTPETGTELWVSDGTEAGTKLLHDATPGPDSSEPAWTAAIGDDVYFTRSSAGLFRLSGGQAAELRPAGPQSSFDVPNQLTVLGTRLCFIAGYDPALWCTDGTQGGTRRLSPDEPGREVRSLKLVGDTLYFSINGQIWQSDGTAEGTRAYAAVPESGAPFGADGFVRLGTALLFSASDPRYGRELWRSDGTSEGTVLVRDLSSTPLDSPITALPSRRGKAYFTATDAAGAFGLWKSDGTSAGTQIVRLLPAGTQTGDGVLVGSRIVFKLITYSEDNPKVELWQTDGTASGTQQIPLPADLFVDSSQPLVPVGSRLIFNSYTAGDGPGDVVSLDTAKRRFTPIRSRRTAGNQPTDPMIVATRHAAYFQSFDRKHGLELWRTDGTRRGTKRVKDATPGASGSAAPLAATADRVFFTTDPQWGTAAGEQHTQTLWSSEGTARTTRKIRTLKTWAPSGVDDDGNATPRPSAIVGPNGLLLYTTYEGSNGLGAELWATDGTRRGNQRLAGAAGDGGLGQGVVLGRRVWFTIGNALWSSNGTASGTAPVDSATAYGVTGKGKSLFYTGSDGELWSVTSPSTTPRQVQDLWPGDGSSYPNTLMFTSTHLLLTADDGRAGRQLFALALPR